MYPLKMIPIYDKTIWGNDRLAQIRGVQDTHLGTSWEISIHPYGATTIANGPYANESLAKLVQLYPKEMLGNVKAEKMLRAAYLDAKDDLSIQVHPYEAYANTHDHDAGKTESWYVLEAKDGARLVAGTNVSDPSLIKQAIENEDMEKYLVYHPIKAGDFIHIPAGELHALGGGILAIEVGTNSNTTYRFYDYGRKDEHGQGRPLHLDKGFDVVDFHLQSKVIHTPIDEIKEGKRKILTNNDDYIVELIDVVDTEVIQLHHKFACLSVVANDAIVEANGVSVEAMYTDSFFIPAACESFEIKGNCRVILSYVA